MTSLTTSDEVVAGNGDGKPRLGIFWFVPADGGGAKLIEESIPAAEIPEVGGFKTYDPGHLEVWQKVVRRIPALRWYPYEDFPRGRANWRAEDDAWLLLMDRSVMEEPFVSAVRKVWRLPASTLVLGDSHYCCRRRVSLPLVAWRGPKH
ncbi:MAG: hypothetical protein ACLGXA_01255 [Acidobacteriota bacterium]